MYDPTQDETIRDISLNFDERETLRWADGAIGIAPRQRSIDALAVLGLIEPDVKPWTHHYSPTPKGDAKLSMIGERG